MSRNNKKLREEKVPGEIETSKEGGASPHTREAETVDDESTHSDRVKLMTEELEKIKAHVKTLGKSIEVMRSTFDSLVGLLEENKEEVVHSPPPPDDGILTPCCGKTLFELPYNERVSFDGSAITCKGPRPSDAHESSAK